MLLETGLTLDQVRKEQKREEKTKKEQNKRRRVIDFYSFQTECVATIQCCGETLLSVINSILDYTKLEATGLQVLCLVVIYYIILFYSD